MDSPDERWLAVVGYEGLYEVSDLGRVRSVRGRWGIGRVLKLPPDFHGRLHVTLHKERKQMVVHVHRLVANAFFGPLPPGMETRHLDGSPHNNAAVNLVYGTRSENQFDAVRHRTNNMARKTHCPAGHPYDVVNTYVTRTGARHCRPCRNAHMKVYKSRQRLIAAQHMPDTVRQPVA